MGDLELLREWLQLLSEGPATVTIQVGNVRYVLPHMNTSLTLVAGTEDATQDGTGEPTYRVLPGYRVTFSGETRYRGGDDIVTRETVDA